MTQTYDTGTTLSTDTISAKEKLRRAGNGRPSTLVLAHDSLGFANLPHGHVQVTVTDLDG